MRCRRKEFVKRLKPARNKISDLIRIQLNFHASQSSTAQFSFSLALAPVALKTPTDNNEYFMKAQQANFLSFTLYIASSGSSLFRFFFHYSQPRIIHTIRVIKALVLPALHFLAKRERE
jgi:hypothetical protein